MERWAVTSQDDAIGKTTAWEVGSAKAEGWEVVYDKHFAIDTTNFAPIVSSILAKKPDVVSLSLSYPTFVIQMIDQLYQQGFKGIIFGQLHRYGVGFDPRADRLPQGGNQQLSPLQ
ncbi:MAG: ABC transporter substrate-binding protein [Halofilum sp. (in: g-proteobacteria)]|nr:ABC transporter substrate-binding protein [Halofilum sp. (in: g-proteobacteria)]